MGEGPLETSRDVPERLEAGTLIAGRYSIIESLGAGGVGVVYRALDRTLDAEVAVKLVGAPDDRVRARARNELRLARKITHPNICRLHDIEETEDGLLLSMALIQGESLDRRLTGQEEVSANWAWSVLHDVAGGLAAAHAEGVVHRDLKPANIVLSDAGHAVIVDFGIAKETTDRTERLTADGAVVGTIEYMAPEQLAGDPIGPECDVYAFGLVAFEMLTGILPNAGETPFATIMNRARDEGPSIAVLRPGLPEGFVALIETCLDQDPDARIPDGQRLVDALERIEEEVKYGSAFIEAPQGDFDERSVEARAEPLALAPTRADTEPTSSEPTTFRRWFLGIAILGMLTVVGVVTGLFWEPSPPDVWERDLPRLPAVSVSSEAGDGLKDTDRWLAAGLHRMVMDALVDDYALMAVPPGTSTAAARLQLTVHQGVSKRWRVEAVVKHNEKQDEFFFDADNPSDLAFAIAKQVAEVAISPEHRGPTPAHLESTGATDKEAWRLWRRARRAGLLQDKLRTRRMARRAIKKDPDFPLPYLELASTYFERNQEGKVAIGRAWALRDKVLGKWWTEIGTYKAYFDRDYDLLLDRATALKDGAPDDMYVQVRYGDLLLDWEMVDDGLAFLERLTRDQPDHPAAFAWLAYYYVGGLQLPIVSPRDVERALAFGERAVELAPGSPTARAALALAYLFDGRLDSARIQAEIAFRWAPDNLAAVLAQLSIAMHAEDFEGVEVAARSLLSTEDILSKAQGEYLLGIAEITQGHFEGGLRRVGNAAARLRQEAPIPATLFFQSQGRFALELGRYELAKNAFEIAAKIWGSVHGIEGDLAVFLAAVAAAEGRSGDAVRMLDEAQGALEAGLLQRGPDLVLRARELRFWSEIIAGRFETAVARYRTLRESRLLSGWVRYHAALAFLEIGKGAEARAEFADFARHPHAWAEPVLRVKAWAHLGAREEAEGRVDAAQAAYERFLGFWGHTSWDLPEITQVRRRIAAIAASRDSSGAPRVHSEENP